MPPRWLSGYDSVWAPAVAFRLAEGVATYDEDDEEEAELVTSYADVLEWYRSARRSMPDPHPQLTREQAVLYRQLQTNSVLTPALARFICPDVYESAKCSVCNSATATLTHVLWDCKLNPEEAAAYPGRLPTDIARTHPTGPRGDSLVENVGSPGVSVETQLDDCTYIVG
ncbi:hypothetical protein HPB49_012986 [Dermacentor silvarum]|uniref:Uncharacterized protein n=1 Tax=Dermacentor silvarum TaxID=543639 RepID=A0ACB8DZX9_DERSI|nr:hypothetical protein HPB49_012986 [Dermacentor silvarum]